MSAGDPRQQLVDRVARLIPGASPSRTSGSPGPTGWPASTTTSSTTASRGERIVLRIFIASRTRSGSPRRSAAPGATMHLEDDARASARRGRRCGAGRGPGGRGRRPGVDGRAAAGPPARGRPTVRAGRCSRRAVGRASSDAGISGEMTLPGRSSSPMQGRLERPVADRDLEAVGGGLLDVDRERPRRRSRRCSGASATSPSGASSGPGACGPPRPSGWRTGGSPASSCASRARPGGAGPRRGGGPRR